MKTRHRILKPGDIVQLNGQGPQMRVIKYIAEAGNSHSNNIVLCHWYAADGEQCAEYHQDHLVRIDDGNSHAHRDKAEEKLRVKVSHDKLIDPSGTGPKSDKSGV